MNSNKCSASACKRIIFKDTQSLIEKRKGDLPTDIDWRREGVVTPVKNQGHCGSCWAFSAAEGIESQYSILTKNNVSSKLMELSEQQILDCTSIPGGGGCKGGAEEYAYATIIQMGGLSVEWTYPYISFYGKDYQCDKTKYKPLVKLSDYRDLQINSYSSLITSLAKVRPIQVSVDASTWSSYSSGIFDGCDKTNVELNHAVQLVGIGVDDDTGLEYWLVRNSWGEDGYIRLLKNSNYTCGQMHGFKVCGTCGIQFRGVYPIVKV